jgi:hypothetical protein
MCYALSDFPSDSLAERLRDRLRLVDLESVDADFESGVAFFNDKAQAGPRRAAEVNVKGLVANAADRFHGDARHVRRLAGIEAIDGALASEWLRNDMCLDGAWQSIGSDTQKARGLGSRIIARQGLTYRDRS